MQSQCGVLLACPGVALQVSRLPTVALDGWNCLACDSQHEREARPSAGNQTGPGLALCTRKGVSPLWVELHQSEPMRSRAGASGRWGRLYCKCSLAALASKSAVTTVRLPAVSTAAGSPDHVPACA